MEAQHEWKRAAHFAEIAEALGVATTDVLAAWAFADVEPDVENHPAIAVLFTRNYKDFDSLVRTAKLARDADGILRLFGDEEETDLTVGSMFR